MKRRLQRLIARRRLLRGFQILRHDAFWHDDDAYLHACIAREKAVYTPSRRLRYYLIDVGWS